jgi:hypothetical protein
MYAYTAWYVVMRWREWKVDILTLIPAFDNLANTNLRYKW